MQCRTCKPPAHGREQKTPAHCIRKDEKMEVELRRAVALIDVIDDAVERMPLSKDQVDTADTIIVLLGMLKDVVVKVSDELEERERTHRNIVG